MGDETTEFASRCSKALDLLAQLWAMREALDGSGVDAEFRRMSAALLTLFAPPSARG